MTDVVYLMHTSAFLRLREVYQREALVDNSIFTSKKHLELYQVRE